MIIEKICYEERMKIYDAINCYAETQAQASFEHLFRFYENNKVNLYHLLGDQLIYEVPENEISTKLNFDMKYKAITDALSSTEVDYWSIYNYCMSYGLCDSFSSFITSLANNTMGKSGKITTDSGIVIEYTAESKTMKTIGKFVKEARSAVLSAVFEEFRNLIAIALNAPRGKLCLSIHPLDFITMSMNANNWRSCMSWDEGEYRQGSVEMMNSPTVICAYIESDNQNYYITGARDSKWNSKSWRELFIVDKNVIINSKGYPYQNISLTKEILALLKKRAKDILGWDYYSEMGMAVCDDSESEITFSFGKDGDEKDTEKRFLFHTGFMYNDLYAYGNEGLNFGYFTEDALVKNPNESCYINVDYSGECECMVCGRTYIEEESMLYCENCDPTEQPIAYCIDCDEPIYDEEELFIDPDSGDGICYSCMMKRREEEEQYIIYKGIHNYNAEEGTNIVSVRDIIDRSLNEQ